MIFFICFINELLCLLKKPNPTLDAKGCNSKIFTGCPLFASPILGTNSEEQNNVDKNLCPRGAHSLWGGPLFSDADLVLVQLALLNPSLIPAVTIFHLLLLPLASSLC